MSGSSGLFGSGCPVPPVPATSASLPANWRDRDAPTSSVPPVARGPRLRRPDGSSRPHPLPPRGSGWLPDVRSCRPWLPSADVSFCRGRSSGPGWRALSGTRHTMHPAFSLVKRYFSTHRVVHRNCGSSPEVSPSSTARPPDPHRVVHTRPRSPARCVDDRASSRHNRSHDVAPAPPPRRHHHHSLAHVDPTTCACSRPEGRLFRFSGTIPPRNRPRTQTRAQTGHRR